MFKILIYICGEPIVMSRPQMTSFLTKRSTPSGGILKEKEYSFLTKRSTPFGPFFDQKEYSFWSIFEAKGVLV